ncbi:MAG: glycosyltransferase, partial [Gemmatimonadota bacterium]
MILLLFGFWCSAVLLAWAYVGYPLFAATGLARVLRQPRRSAGAPTGCVLLVPAHNEQEVIEAKIRNGLALAWAGDGRLDVVVVSDGSTDRTEELARRYASQTDRVRLIVCPQRRGKNAALNAAVAELDPPPDCLLLFTDANAIFDTGAASELARVLEGGAACAIGKLTFVDAATDTARAEGLYWRYENWIKRSEGAVGRAIAANGAILAARRRDVPELPSGVPNDWWIPLTLLARDRRVEYAPAAEAVEAAPQRKGEEFSRKVRMANRQMTGVLRIWRDLDAATRFQVVSHKLLRWLGLPLILIAT